MSEKVKLILETVKQSQKMMMRLYSFCSETQLLDRCWFKIDLTAIVKTDKIVDEAQFFLYLIQKGGEQSFKRDTNYRNHVNSTIIDLKRANARPLH